MTGIVVIGGGHAGAAVVASLRSRGYDGGLTLVCDEPVAPYQRPPLTKKYLTGEMPVERMLLRPQAWYRDAGITLHLNTRAEAIDRSAQQIRTGAGVLDYDRLVLATGAAPRRLPAAVGGDLAGVHVARSMADADALATAFRPGQRLLVVGGGYIGLEAAAVAAGLGMRVTLIEQADRILGRVACAETADWFRRLHRSHGVTILEGRGLNRLTGAEGRVVGAVLSNGEEIAVDCVLAGIGVSPNTALAEAAGLAVDNGICVDAGGRSSDPAIYAVGDCASFEYRGRRIRLESVQNANDQSEIVARTLLDEPAAYNPSPWFWSDQYDVKLQIAGLNHGYTHVVTREDKGTSFWYFQGPDLIALDAINDPRSYMIGKRLIDARRSPDARTLADPQTDLKSLL